MNKNHIKLLSATALGDRKAFQNLYQETSAQLYAIGLNMLKDKSLAEDALQETYINVWHNASEYRNTRGTVLTWMIGIIRYRALDILRAKNTRMQKDRLQKEEFDEAITKQDGPEMEWSNDRQRVRLDDCLDELEKPQADAISLAYFKGYTHREICQHMLSPLGSVKSWIRRGLQRLRRCLEL